jgi:hypothetical protein
VEFEPTIPVFELAKAVHALDRAATVIGFLTISVAKFCTDFLYHLQKLTILSVTPFHARFAFSIRIFSL